MGNVYGDIGEGKPEDDVMGTPAVPDVDEDPNEYAYVVNKFGKAPQAPRWEHMAVTGYLTDDEAIEWINDGGPRA